MTLLHLSLSPTGEVMRQEQEKKKPEGTVTLQPATFRSQGDTSPTWRIKLKDCMTFIAEQQTFSMQQTSWMQGFIWGLKIIECVIRITFSCNIFKWCANISSSLIKNVFLWCEANWFGVAGVNRHCCSCTGDCSKKPASFEGPPSFHTLYPTQASKSNGFILFKTRGQVLL